MHRIFIAENFWKLCMVLVFAASVIALPTMGQITEAKAHGLLAPTQEMSPQTVTINGTVTSVTESMLTIVDDGKTEHTIGLNPKTRISKGGKVASAAEIKANDSVVVVASKGEGSNLTAVTITVT
jgi:hypothetical protein